VEVEIPIAVITITVPKLKAVREGKGLISSQQKSLIIFTRKGIHQGKRIEGK
jgi:hypothetical protein